MAKAKRRGPKKAAHVETALVARPVVEATLEPADESIDYESVAIRTLQIVTAQNTRLVELMTDQHQATVLQVKVMADAFTDSLRGQVEASRALQDAEDRKDDRKLKRERARRHDELMESTMREGLALLPVLATKFAGQPLLARKEAALVQPFIAALSKDELRGVLHSLSPSNRNVLIQILRALPDQPDGPISDEKEDGSNGTH